MRFLVDAQLPPALCRWLEGRGHEADHVFEILGAEAEDIEIAALTESGSYILISKDEDFLHLRRSDRFPLLWLRCGNTTNRLLVEWLEERWKRVEKLLAANEGLIELS
jgi:predicted nuclease of predicted toxin-antitoxin system